MTKGILGHFSIQQKQQERASKGMTVRNWTEQNNEAEDRRYNEIREIFRLGWNH